MSTKKATAKKRPAGLSDREAQQILQTAEAAPPALTHAQMEDMEKMFGADPFAVARRMGLAVLAMSGRDLHTKVKADRASAVAFARMGNDLLRYIEALNGLLELMNRAQMKLLIAGTVREDMSAVMAEAKGDAS